LKFVETVSVLSFRFKFKNSLSLAANFGGRREEEQKQAPACTNDNGHDGQHHATTTLSPCMQTSQKESITRGLFQNTEPAELL
jgi:hypothetical protein